MIDEQQKVWVLSWATAVDPYSDGIPEFEDQYGLNYYEQVQLLSVVGVYKGLLTAIQKANTMIREEGDPDLAEATHANSFQPYAQGYVYKTGHLSFYVQEMEVDETPWQPGQGIRS